MPDGTRMHIYEVVRWGNDAEDPLSGGPNGPDTCFLVRALSIEDAAGVVDRRLADMPHERVQPWAHAVYLLGEESVASDAPRILRGPYIQSAYCHGWRQWHRNERDEPWQEKI
ncbi:hypothetical protein LAG73_05710 [Pseudoxanthomonas japonensis]|nr:hypothetical protein LAG73_05710 [Pseudoxanthomonas japonensis]